jgi:hypothetical protein
MKRAKMVRSQNRYRSLLGKRNMAIGESVRKERKTKYRSKMTKYKKKSRMNLARKMRMKITKEMNLFQKERTKKNMMKKNMAKKRKRRKRKRRRKRKNFPQAFSNCS